MSCNGPMGCGDGAGSHNPTRFGDHTWLRRPCGLLRPRGLRRFHCAFWWWAPTTWAAAAQRSAALTRAVAASWPVAATPWTETMDTSAGHGIATMNRGRRCTWDAWHCGSRCDHRNPWGRHTPCGRCNPVVATTLTIAETSGWNPCNRRQVDAAAWGRRSPYGRHNAMEHGVAAAHGNATTRSPQDRRNLQARHGVVATHAT